jgi:CBS domain-containing protein
MNIDTTPKTKSQSVVTIAPEATIGDAVALMKGKSIGAIVVSADGVTLAGILSERDVVHALADRGPAVMAIPVTALMTRHVFTCQPNDGIAELMAEMTKRRIRHLPVVDGGRLAGIVSIGDVVKNRLDEVESEASSLRQFITSA